MIRSYQGKKPKIHESAWIAETAVIVGDVTVEENANIWYGAVLRGDEGPIVVEAGANVQDNVTVHTFVKSVPACRVNAVGNGHCAFNRTYGAYLMPDPDGGVGEVLGICKHHDDRLFNDIGGAVWNFPMSRKGRITVDLKIMEKQARFVLADRWYNTCDPYAAIQSPFWFELDVDSETEIQ